MDIKVEIGKRIKTIRTNKGLTQADICNDESEITIRQLARIENGQSMATIPKLIYLSNQLEVSINELVDIHHIELPKRYLELKNKLIRFHTYGDAERIAKQEEMFDEIYNQFYDFLPEEEQLLVEVLQVHANVFSSLDSGFGIGLLEEYFHQVLKKKKYTYNDLLIINVYFLCCALGLEDRKHFDTLSKKILKYIDYSDLDSMYLLERIVISILSQINESDYLTYTKVLREIIKESNHFQHKPLVYLFEAKYYFKVENNENKSVELYEKAIIFAKMLNDDVLVKNLEKERDNDLVT
ncbi:XRE family transcriptional regulator [Streptococcus sp. sy018]|uniref:helix-turn-helix domain-containing protein n=1 Tax=Streptococcus sp. sy018 TaxID=2600147 RepID=UPI0011B5AD5F|nr:XRE family transcriptional regulator [Streptococcus sp. sy018]TWS94376.1 helix-turn-helix transcriptional regulator [Streptococcus sp. sy018]